MIDLTKAPEGATHYGLISNCAVIWYLIDGDSYRFYDEGTKSWSALGSMMPPIWPVVKIDSWNIYNNTLPLSELSDEQRGLLFNHRCNGGDIETESSSGWGVINYPQWIFTSTYRAKQKTERELFIDEWSSTITTNEYNGGNVRSLVGQMFDDLKINKEK